MPKKTKENKEETASKKKEGPPATKEEAAAKRKGSLLEAVMRNAVKDYGRSVIIMPDDEEEIKNRIARLNVIPSGSLSYDRMTGIGGVPQGRVIEITGKEGAGKSSTLVLFAKAAQKIGYKPIYIDVEHRLDVEYAERLGMPQGSYYLVLPNSSDEVFDVVDKAVRTGEKVFIIIDSVSALVNQRQLSKEWSGKREPGVLARDMNEFLKRVNPALSKSKSVLAFTNQDRMAIATFGGYKTQTGGKALPYYSTHRMSIRKARNKQGEIKIVEGGEVIGYYMIMQFLKTNTAAAPSERKICFKYNHGFWREEEIFNIGVEEGIIGKAGGWFSFEDFKSHGKLEFRDKIAQDKRFGNKIEKEIREKWEMPLLRS